MNDLDALLAQWDALSGAIDGVLVAQPYQMTEKAERLAAEKLAMRKLIQDYALKAHRALSPSAPTQVR